MRAHGAGILEQLIVLEAVEQLASQRGLVITQADIDREYEDGLRRLVDPVADLTTGPFDRAQAEGILDTVLAGRNISREEFQLTVRRNVFLRHVVEADLAITEDLVQAEFERAYGERVQCRHIQLATRGEVARAQERLAAGESFADVARRYSANLASGEKGGLLEPFSLQDDSVPLAMREAAAGLTPGSPPSVLRTGEWYHILQLEQVLPAADVTLADVRDELDRRLRSRLAEPGVRDLYERLFREATLEIHDPALREVFDRKHPERGKQARP